MSSARPLEATFAFLVHECILSTPSTVLGEWVNFQGRQLFQIAYVSSVKGSAIKGKNLLPKESELFFHFREDV